MASDLASLAERARREGPLPAAVVWAAARQSLEALAADPAATPEDLRQLGASVWLALTGQTFPDPARGESIPWAKLDAAGITPDLGALPVLLARTLAADPAQAPPTAEAVLAALNMLATLRPAVPVWPDMPSRAPGPDPAPPPESRPPVPAHSELWTRRPAQLAATNRRRRHSADVWNTLLLLVAGGLGGFAGGVLYEKTHGLGAAVTTPGAVPTASAPDASSPPPAPDLPLPPSPPVAAAAVAARVQRVKILQPDVGDILKYARELRRVATLPVTDAATFPSESQFTRLTQRFDWKQPDSPNFHRTPLLLVLGYANDPAASQQCADQMAQILKQSGIASPIYCCGLGSGEAVPEVEAAGVGTDGRFVEVWVGFTLF